MPDANEEPGRHTPDLIWFAAAVIADISAVVTVARSSAEIVFVILGVSALLAGVYRIAIQRNKPVGRWIILPIISIMAGSGALGAVIDRSATANSQTTTGSSEASNGGGNGRPDGVEKTQKDGNASPSPAPSRTRSTETLSLLDAKQVGDEETYYKTGP